jgi:hypothetical protein
MADFVRQYGPYYRQYGVATTTGGQNSKIQIGIPTFNDANLYTGALAAGDVKVSIDGGAEANIATLPVQIAAATGIWVWTLSAAELTGSTVTVHLKKAGVTAEMVITVEMRLALGPVQFGSSSSPAATNGLLTIGSAGAAGFRAIGTTTGQGILATGGATADGFSATGGTISGNGISASALLLGHGMALTAVGTGSRALELIPVAGAPEIFFIRKSTAVAGAASTITLDAGASATNDFYNEMKITIIAGTGLGQSRMINSYVGGTKIATVTRPWLVNPDATSVFIITTGADIWDSLEGAEPTGPIPDNSTFRRICQYLKRRFYNKVDQTNALQRVYQDNSASVLTSMAVSSDSITQVKGKTS